MRRRVLGMAVALAAGTLWACTYDPKYDANGIKCTNGGSCPSGYRCVMAVGARTGVCCNKPDQNLCLGPAGPGPDSAVPTSEVAPDLAAPLPDVAPDLAAPLPDAAPDTPTAPADLAVSPGEGGQIVCEPDCVGRECGSDGCNGSCGLCTGGGTCTPAGRCWNGTVGGSTGSGGSAGAGGTTITGGSSGSGGSTGYDGSTDSYDGGAAVD